MQLKARHFTGQDMAKPEPDGSFNFSIVPDLERLYFVSVEYQGAVYSSSLSAMQLGRPVELTVFDSTNETGAIKIGNHTVIVAGANPIDGFVEIIERVEVFNNGLLTLVPNMSQSGPGMLSLLRFALPPNAYNLDVSSSLIGGDILEVDRGFALTNPIPPTAENAPHEYEFVYRLRYGEGYALDLSRTLRFGANSFRFVVPTDSGSASSTTLADLGAAEFEDRLLRIFEGGPIKPGSVMVINVAELPGPPLFDVVMRKTQEWFMKSIAPMILLLTFLFLIVLGIRRSTSTRSVADPKDDRDVLIERLRQVVEQYHQGSISGRQYMRYEDTIRKALIRRATEGLGP